MLHNIFEIIVHD